MRADEATESSNQCLRFLMIKCEAHVALPALDDHSFSGKHGPSDFGKLPQEFGNGGEHASNLSDNQSDVNFVAESAAVSKLKVDWCPLKSNAADSLPVGQS